MILRDVEYEHVWGGSGVQGFFGEKYPWHKYFGPFKPDFTGMTLVAKTTTLNPKKGHMDLRKDGITPVKLFPDCVWCPPMAWLRGVALNSVGLSGPGITALLEMHKWQHLNKPFILSFMSVAATKAERLQELREFVAILRPRIDFFRTPFALQINFSCPNVGLDTAHLLEEIAEALEIASALDIPLIPKLSITADVSVAIQLEKNPNCDALCVTNTLPIGSFPNDIDWVRLIGTDKPEESPLIARGYTSGGFSGKPLLPLLIKWTREAKRMAPNLKINAGGGILCKGDALKLVAAGADGVALGSIAFLRPWRMQSTTQAVNHHFFTKERIRNRRSA